MVERRLMYLSETPFLCVCSDPGSVVVVVVGVTPVEVVVEVTPTLSAAAIVAGTVPPTVADAGTY